MDMNTNITIHRVAKSTLPLYQFFGSTFPVGGFQHSYGLETYIAEGIVHNAKQLKEYLFHVLRQVYITFDGRAFCKASHYGGCVDLSELLKLDQEVTAMRLTKESRQASLKTGRAFLRMASAITSDPVFEDYWKTVQKQPDIGNYCIAVGFLMGRIKQPEQEALRAYYFNDLNNLLQVGVKTIPLGQTEGQMLLYELYSEIENAVMETIQEQQEELQNFVPYMNLMSMRHEILYSRLYMS